MSDNPAINQQTRQLEVLVRVSSLLSTLDLDRVLNEVVRLTTEVVGASKGSFFLLDDHNDGVENSAGTVALQRFLAARNYDPEMKQYVSARVLTEGLAHWVMTEKDAAVVEDTLTDPRWITLEGETLGARSALCVPFFFEDQVYGILTLEHPEPGHFADSDRRLAKAVASQASSAMRNAQLFDRTQSQQRQMEAVLVSTSEALFSIDARNRLSMMNPAAEGILGLNAADAVGLSIDTLAEYSPLLNEVVTAMHKTTASGDTKTFEVEDRRSHHDFTVSVSLMREDGRHESGAVVALHDVTSLKDLSRLKTHMLQMASHDLKNPLGVLLGYLDMLREDAEHGIIPDAQFIEGMFRSVERMENLIQTLLNQDRIDAQTAQQLQPVNPSKLLDMVMDDMRESARAMGHNLVIEAAPNLPMLSGDPVELREAMGNLMSNAIKYTPYGGTITVRMTAEDNRFFFSVSDTGLGIPLDQQSGIFGQYFRAKQAATAEIKGTGLGLSLVKATIEQHGGNVWFQSEEGVGSTFGFWLPVLSPALD
jgi:PAS domain S-box-containing protein